MYQPITNPEECHDNWDDKPHFIGSKVWWRFVWLKKPVDKESMMLAGYKFIPLTKGKRLWWVYRWLGTGDTLFPFQALPFMITFTLSMLASTIVFFVGVITILRWIFGV